jgi:uncharacterized protein (DUF2336 family)
MGSQSSYEAAKRLAQDGAEVERRAVATLPDTPPELLYYLAGDGSAAVRSAVAGNAAAPAQADRLLAGDADPAVRAMLGRKLAPRAAALAIAEDKLGAIAWQALCSLAEDTAVHVRAVIAEELKAMPDAPHDLILRLAGDVAMDVAEPVIRLSPMLSEEDLLALVAAPPVPDTLSAVARRPALSECLSDAIAASADEAAIGALLANPSAAIREQTLDGLILQAATRIRWQESLVRRPSLPPRAQRALALCVAGHLLQDRVEARLLEGAAEPPAGARFEAAALRGDHAAMARLLAQEASVTLQLVEQAVRLRSARALVSLCWQAGFGLRCAMLAQSVLGQLAPGAALVPGPDGGWPLSTAEMLWQIDLLAEPMVGA